MKFTIHYYKTYNKETAFTMKRKWEACSPAAHNSSITTHLFTFTLYSLVLQKSNSVSREPVGMAKLNVRSDISVVLHNNLAVISKAALIISGNLIEEKK